ncbi:MAG: AraC family transcriptional regulator [Spirosomataceae bacterium]
MSIRFEKILPDVDSSFRVLYQNVCADSFTWDYHYHPEIELVFVPSGNGRSYVGNHLSYYEDGDFILIGENVPHAGFGYGSQSVHEEWVIQFRKEIFTEGALGSLPELNDILFMLKKAACGIRFKGEARKVCAQLFPILAQKKGLARLLTLLEILYYLAHSSEFELLNEKRILSSSNKDFQRTTAILDFVAAHFSEQIQTSDVAEITHLSLAAFCHYFKRNFQQSFTDFLNEYRVNQACLLLAQGKTVSEAAFLVGFNSLPYFSLTFKRIKNCSPSAYRKAVSTFVQ